MNERATNIRMARSVVFVDADNTLWDTNDVFAAAQLNLLGAVEAAVGQEAAVSDRLSFVRSLDQAIAERHHAGLRYPPRLLAQAVALALRGKQIEVAARTVQSGTQSDVGIPLASSDEIEIAFIQDLQALPALLPGVREGLETLRAVGALILMLTEGSRTKALRSAHHHLISDSFDRVIESPKTPRLYERVMKLTRGSSKAFMIGDQLQRDIQPAMAAGVTAIYIPGAFRPRWELSEKRIQPNFTVKSFDEAAAIVAQDRFE